MMICISRLKGIVVAMTALVAVFVVACGTANAQVNWRASATGTNTLTDVPGVDLDVFRGRSSQLGEFTGVGFHAVDFDSFAVTGCATWTAANGDSLNVIYEGQVFFSGDPDFPFGSTADFIVVGGTGRFADAEGTGMMLAGFTDFAPGEFFFDFEGALHPQGK